MIYPFLSSVSEYSADFLSIAPVFPSIASVKIGHYFDYRIIKRRAERIYDAGLFRADNQRLYYICVGRDSAQNEDNRYGDRVAQNGEYRRHEQFKVYVFYRFGNEIRQKSRDERGERSYENIVNSVT